jgi:hypothetical protein
MRLSHPLAAVALVLAATELASAQQCTVAQPPGRCLTDTDCLNGRTCDTAINECRCNTVADCAFNGGSWACAAGHCQAGNSTACSLFSRSNNLCICTQNAQCGAGVCSNSVCNCPAAQSVPAFPVLGRALLAVALLAVAFLVLGRVGIRGRPPGAE